MPMRWVGVSYAKIHSCKLVVLVKSALDCAGLIALGGKKLPKHPEWKIDASHLHTQT